MRCSTILCSSRTAQKSLATNVKREAATYLEDVLEASQRWACDVLGVDRTMARDRFVTPRLRFKRYPALNAWLEVRCFAHARRSAHPEYKDQSIWEMLLMGAKVSSDVGV